MGYVGYVECVGCQFRLAEDRRGVEDRRFAVFASFDEDFPLNAPTRADTWWLLRVVAALYPKLVLRSDAAISAHTAILPPYIMLAWNGF